MLYQPSWFYIVSRIHKPFSWKLSLEKTNVGETLLEQPASEDEVDFLLVLVENKLPSNVRWLAYLSFFVMEGVLVYSIDLLRSVNTHLLLQHFSSFRVGGSGPAISFQLHVNCPDIGHADTHLSLVLEVSKYVIGLRVIEESLCLFTFLSCLVRDIYCLRDLIESEVKLIELLGSCLVAECDRLFLALIAQQDIFQCFEQVDDLGSRFLGCMPDFPEAKEKSDQADDHHPDDKRVESFANQLCLSLLQQC